MRFPHVAIEHHLPERLRAAESAGTCVEPYTSLCGILYGGPWGPIPLFGDYTPQAE